MWGFSRRYNVPVEKVLDYSAPINFLGGAPKIVETIRTNAELIRFYPDPNPKELKQQIADYIGGVEPENIVIGNGSIELIYLITEVMPSNFKAIIPVPTFSEYEKTTLRSHGKPVFVKLGDDFSLEVEAVERAVTEDTRLIFVCNPNSPTGTLFEKDKILEIVDFCHKRDIKVCVDENYIDFVASPSSFTVGPNVKEYNNLFVINSLSKFFGVPGLRFGYGTAAKELVSIFEDVGMPWNINSLAICAAKTALKDEEFIKKTKKLVAEQRSELIDMLGNNEFLEVIPSCTNFVLVKILRGLTSTKLKEAIARRGILIRDCSTFVGLDDSYFRVTVRSSEENLRLVKTLKEIFKKSVSN